MIDIMHVINLYKRTDRAVSLVEQCKKQSVPIMLWEGVLSEKTPAANINKAHKAIVQYAKDRNLPYVIIAEDDIVFTDKGAWDFYLKNMPTEFDLYLGMVYSAQVENNQIINGFSGLTLYAINSGYYDFFLSMPPAVHIDRHMGQYAHQYKYFVCPEFVCHQSGGYSDNLKRHMTYEPLLQDRVMYKLKN